MNSSCMCMHSAIQSCALEIIATMQRRKSFPAGIRSSQALSAKDQYFELTASGLLKNLPSRDLNCLPLFGLPAQGVGLKLLC